MHKLAKKVSPHYTSDCDVSTSGYNTVTGQQQTLNVFICSIQFTIECFHNLPYCAEGFSS